MIRNKTILLVLALSLQAALFSQLSTREIDRLTEEAMEHFNTAGAAVVVVKDGKVIHSKGYGVKSIENGEPVDEHTLFAIASNTKAFTTTALAILVEDGKLNWTDRVREHIPEFRMYDAYVTEHFNIVDLVTHRSGLGLGAGDLTFIPPGSDFTIEDILTIFQHFEPVSAFRTKYDYDNLLYQVAGEVVARVSGMTWEDFVSTRIFGPLGMENSHTSITFIDDPSSLATPHSDEGGSLRTVSHFVKEPGKGIGAAGNIVSCVDDLGRWLLVNLNEGKYGDDLEKQLFSEKTRDYMWTIHTTKQVNRNPRYNSHFAGYGLGWDLVDVCGNLSAGHTGGLPGMLSKTILVPDLELGVVVLTNTSEGGAGVFNAVSQTIVDSYLGLEPFDWIGEYETRFEAYYGKADSVTAAVWETVKSNSDHRVDASRFTGTYEDPWFGRAEVYLSDGQLWFRSLRSPGLTGPMHYYKASSFAIPWEYRDLNGDAFAIFILDEEGSATGIRMKGISPAIDFSYDFQDLDFKRIGP